MSLFLCQRNPFKDVEERRTDKRCVNIARIFHLCFLRQEVVLPRHELQSKELCYPLRANEKCLKNQISSILCEFSLCTLPLCFSIFGQALIPVEPGQGQITEVRSF